MTAFPTSYTASSLTLTQRWLRALLLTGITAVSAQMAVQLPHTPVPVTFQTFAVLLSGLLLGSRWGAVAQAQYLALGLLGAPVFAFGKAGVGVLLLPYAGGYLLSYTLAAFLVGWIVERGKSDETEAQRLRRSLWACAAGLAVIYTFGCTWLALSSRPMLSPAAALLAGAGWFALWDIVKALAAVALVTGLAPRLFAPRGGK